MSPRPSTRGDRLNEDEETNRHGSAGSAHGQAAAQPQLLSWRFAPAGMTAMPSSIWSIIRSPWIARVRRNSGASND